MADKCFGVLATSIFWFIFGFLAMAVLLTIMSALIAADGRYLESATYYHGRPTSRAFYEGLVANGHYKTLTVYIGLLSLVGGIIFVILFALSKRQKPADAA
jgi:hypothetical protein